MTQPDQPDQGGLSLEEIEQDRWGDPPADATRLVRTAYQLRRQPVADLTPEDLRLLISQKVSVEVLVPRALVVLAQDPLAEGDYYPGDLLVATMKLSADYWDAHQDQANSLRKIAAAARSGEIDSELQTDIDSFLTRTAQSA